MCVCGGGEGVEQFASSSTTALLKSSSGLEAHRQHEIQGRIERGEVQSCTES